MSYLYHGVVYEIQTEVKFNQYNNKSARPKQTCPTVQFRESQRPLKKCFQAICAPAVRQGRTQKRTTSKQMPFSQHWLYAYLTEVGSAKLIEALCENTLRITRLSREKRQRTIFLPVPIFSAILARLNTLLSPTLFRIALVTLHCRYNLRCIKSPWLLIHMRSAAPVSPSVLRSFLN